MDTLENCGKTLMSHQKKISNSLQTVRGLMDELNYVTNSRSDLEANIMSETNNYSLVERRSMLKAISLRARTESASDLATALFILIQLERQYLGLDYIACPDTGEWK